MLATVRRAFAEAFQNLRTNFFQTLLSVLGIIIGVAALVTMLALIDGFEKIARDAISENTSFESVIVSARTHRTVDGARIPLEAPVALRRATVDSMVRQLPYPGAGMLFARGAVLVPPRDTGAPLGIRFTALSLPLVGDPPSISHGRMLDGRDTLAPALLVNEELVRRYFGPDTAPEEVLGRFFAVAGDSLPIVGVTGAGAPGIGLEIILPLSVFERLPDAPAANVSVLVDFGRVEDVRPGADFMEAWFANRYPDVDGAVEVTASLDMVEKVETGFSVFRLVMGFLIGIAVVVGGVGVMNVLLMAINERTAEIGVRKAVGADRKGIMVQFLAESVAVSAIGSSLGMALGVVASLTSAVVISYFGDFDFAAVFTIRTLLVVVLVALVTGIVFGTYPARRAAKLDPVTAIQRS